ncbi:MAG: GNAT family N-acetyltransferase [Clostridium sp.]|jgi:GNAT superfamily N-acetyltransferase|nr:GNAT family N-acetyltransferase [Clostridium sp.]
MVSVKIEKALACDAEKLLDIQRRAFKPLYDIYGDEESPFLENLTSVVSGIEYPKGAYYKIFDHEVLCGGLFVFQLGNGQYKIGLVYVLPEYQYRGIGSEAILLAEDLETSAVSWEIDFPVDRIQNRRCYEKIGYTDTGRREVINDKLILAFYQKIIGG